jgi:hypothetical protein
VFKRDFKDKEIKPCKRKSGYGGEGSQSIAIVKINIYI